MKYKKYISLVMVVLGCFAFFGCGQDELSLRIKKAKKGDVESQHLLGDAYYAGTEVEQDLTEALKWYRLAAEQGDEASRLQMGRAYYSGKGVPQNDTEAMKWLRPLAMRGNAEAQLMVGSFYYMGAGVKQDYAVAYAWCNTPLTQKNKTAVKLRGKCIQKMSSSDKERANVLSKAFTENNSN